MIYRKLHVYLFLMFSALTQAGDTDYQIPLAATQFLQSAYRYFMLPTKTFSVENLEQTKNPVFDPSFSWGVCTSSSQIEENLNNTWSASSLAKYQRPDIKPATFGCKSYQYWQDDIDKIAYLGCNAYRFSIEWSRIEPQEGVFDQKALLHYQTICKTLQKRGIKPMVCLHHYADPIWFLEKGGFTKEKNIDIFLRYCNKVYDYLHDYVQDWIVISQPIAYAMKGYKTAMHPPFLVSSGLESTVALHLLKAHIAVYDAFHQQAKISNQPIQIGICHQIVQMKALRKWNPIDNLIAMFADRIYNKSFLRFFSTGYFCWLTPQKTIAYIPEAPQKFDFFALSYYSPLSFYNTTPMQPEVALEYTTDDPRRIISPEGLYDALIQAAQLGKPVYLAENGITTTDEKKATFFFNSQLSAIAKAKKDGYNIAGYFPWTLMDNYEWGLEHNATHFGLYYNRAQADGSIIATWNNHEAMLKPSGHCYKNIVNMQESA